MDLFNMKIKKEEPLDIEDNNENYLKLDFEIGVKVENDSPVFQDWCLQNAEYQEPLIYGKEESDVTTCFLCFTTFPDSYSLIKHNVTHLAVVLKPQRLYQCDHCLCYYTSKVKIRKHIQTKHFLLFIKRDGFVSVKNHQCSICRKVFTYKRWHAHMGEVHGTEEIRCGDCNITFKCIRYYRRHLLYKHENIRPSWRFHNVHNLDPMEEFKCEQCPSIFKNRSSYKTHLRNCHSGGVNECMVCHSRLKSRSYLLTHMKRVHYNDGKAHKCNICCKVFRSPRYLTIHKRNAHHANVKKIDHHHKIDQGD